MSNRRGTILKILFSTNQLNYRGTSVALIDYAKYNQEILGNESVIHYKQPAIDGNSDMNSELKVVESLKSSKMCEIVQNEDLNLVAGQVKPDLIYHITSGLITDYNPTEYGYGYKNVNHAVFQYRGSHIDAYVSRWLTNCMSKGKIPYVPHIVNLPIPTKDFRKQLNIPENAVVVGRYGGYESFDIYFVKEYIKKNIDELSKKDFYFLFVNTQPFIQHKHVIHINPIYGLQQKSNFINTCDIMLHARTRGETFGMAICEFMFFNKPVLAWNNGLDKNHIKLLKEFQTLYKDEESLNSLLANYWENGYAYDIMNWSNVVSDFSPENVMKKFKEVFIDESYK